MIRNTPPIKNGYTIYTISDCKYCNMVKDDIKTKIKVVDCDYFIKTLRGRDKFYKYIHKYTITPYIHFPMIFKDGKFIGGYKEFISL